MILIDPSKYSTALELFKPLEHHLLIRSFFENDLEAQLFVDNDTQPKAGLIAYNKRFILGGDPALNTFNADLIHYFVETVIPDGESFLVRFTSDEWIPPLMPPLNLSFMNHVVTLAPRLSLEITPEPITDLIIPSGFSFHQVSPEFLASNIGGMDALREEMCSERRSVEDFLTKSFGICPVYENQIAGWCLSEYNTGDECEIGIATLEPYQGKGIATLLTKAFLNEAAQHGYHHIGWDCWKKNIASVSTARKVGFKVTHREQAMVVIL
jgi:GNAT superfamily N-acetyltransferase